MDSVKVYFDTFSQPSRAVLLLLAANQIKYDPCLIKIAQGIEFLWHRFCLSCSITCVSLCMHKGETRTREDFLKVSASRTVPAMDDNGFHLFERYACQIYTSNLVYPCHSSFGPLQCSHHEVPGVQVQVAWPLVPKWLEAASQDWWIPQLACWQSPHRSSLVFI